MRIIRQLSDLPTELRGGAVSIGNFDGVHRGHVSICRQLTAAAKRVNGAAIVFTFDPHPATILRPDRVPAPLVWTERKAELLGALGIDALVAFPTNAEILQQSPQAFFEDVVVGSLGARVMVEGPNFCFGRDRAGNIERLQQLAEPRDVMVEVVELLEEHGDFVSSSRIRTLLADGDVQGAAELLTRPHRVRGQVVRGAGRGAGIGFATANLEQLQAAGPAPGVYAGRGRVGSNWRAAAIHIGPIPTFADAVDRLEVHLLGHTGELYGERLEVDFFERLRDIRAFDGVEQLRTQLCDDVAAAEAAYSRYTCD